MLISIIDFYLLNYFSNTTTSFKEIEIHIKYIYMTYKDGTIITNTLSTFLQISAEINKRSMAIAPRKEQYHYIVY